MKPLRRVLWPCFAAILGVFLTACTSRYQAMFEGSMRIGYDAESVGPNVHRIRYVGTKDADYALLRRHLFRYAASLCDKDALITDYSEEMEVLTIIAHGSRVHRHRYVTALLECSE